MSADCEPPTTETLERAWDIDMHDCPCGHLYGAHEYEYELEPRRMKILRCLECGENYWPVGERR